MNKAAYNALNHDRPHLRSPWGMRAVGSSGKSGGLQAENA
jgi:hypothetical protein